MFLPLPFFQRSRKVTHAFSLAVQKQKRNVMGNELGVLQQEISYRGPEVVLAKLGVRGDLEGYKAILSERFVIKDRGIFRVSGDVDVRSGSETRRSAYGCKWAHCVEQDQGDFLGQSSFPGSASTGREFRSNCMRCLYFALDRPDVQFTAKEISRAMASPTIHADETLKALSRYLAGHPLVLWRYPRQEWTEKVGGLRDSNWAACPVTRKSLSATCLMLGKHPIFAASSTQTI